MKIATDPFHFNANRKPNPSINKKQPHQAQNLQIHINIETRQNLQTKMCDPTRIETKTKSLTGETAKTGNGGCQKFTFER